MEPVDSQVAGVVGGERDLLGELRDVERHLEPKPLKVNIKVGKGSASSVPSTHSPVPRVSPGKDMKALMAVREKEKEE